MLKPEDAAEEILRGEPYIWCAICEGAGTHGEHNSGEFATVHCTHCEGKGYIVRPAYRDACKVLKREPPPFRPMMKSVTFTTKLSM